MSAGSSPRTKPAPETLVSTDGTELREAYAEVGDVRLHYVEAGEGPLIVLLHGFPEFWFSWRLQIAPLAAAGFRVVAPDLRGYNLSSRPAGVEAYSSRLLAADVRGLIRELGAESALLVGHDWGGTVAWATAMSHPEVVDRLVIMNAAHPRKLNEGLRHPNQLRKLWYFFFFQLPGLPERIVRAGHWRFFRRYQRDARPPYTPEETERYVESWSQPDAAVAIINYYGPKLAEPERDDVPNLDRVERLSDASHWVHHDEHERVTQLLIDFFAPARPSEDSQTATT
jgi:epoxide hydrolase 4